MSADFRKLDPADAWAAWSPSPAEPWTARLAGHLLRRAAFMPNWSELQAALRDGPAVTLDRLFAGGPGSAEFDEVMDAAAPADPAAYFDGGRSRPAAPLQAWWLHRMVLTPHPLRERMALFWHGHFATSIDKVKSAALMRRQNLLFRSHALGDFGELVREVSRDPAMLIWLDGNSNSKGRPNENYARELFELFTLGVGHYSERDVREAARAFTGWHTAVDPTNRSRFPGRTAEPATDFIFRRALHDDGPKTVLGRTGNLDGAAVVGVALDQPACARLVVRKLYRHFVSEAADPSDDFLEPLAERLRRDRYTVAGVLRVMLASKHFYSDAAVRQRVKGPAEYLVGLLRAWEVQPVPGVPFPPPEILEGLGQALFAPPTVKGWDGGRAWLSSATLLARQNLAWRCVDPGPGRVPPSGRPETPLGATDLPALLRRHARGPSADARVEFLLELMLQPSEAEAGAAARARLADFLNEGGPAGGERRLCEAAHAVMMMPVFQLA